MAAFVTVRVVGADVADNFLMRMGMAGEAAVRNKVQVGSFEPYAYGIETGYFRSGKLARRAGGSFFLQRSVKQTINRVRPMLVKALGSGDVNEAGRVLQDVAEQARATAETLAPRRSGRLARSIRVVLATGAGNGGLNGGLMR